MYYYLKRSNIGYVKTCNADFFNIPIINDFTL